MVNTKKLPTVDMWAPRESSQGGPFSALGCGDAWCVVDRAGGVAWVNPTNEISALADRETAEFVAKTWNSESISQ